MRYRRLPAVGFIAAIAAATAFAPIASAAEDHRSNRQHSSNSSHRSHHRGGNAGAAIVGGMIGLGLGAAIAGSSHPYYAAPYYPAPGYGATTINAFSFQNTRIIAADTVFAGNGSDSVRAGAGDRIGTGNGSVVGGTHLWQDADIGAGSIGFGSNDSVASTTYDTVAGIATRGSADGTSIANVTITNFDKTEDFLFYQNQSISMTSAIIATAQSTVVGATPSSVIYCRTVLKLR
jgi:hypothetical protein